MSEPSTSTPPLQKDSENSNETSQCDRVIRRMRLRVGRAYETSVYFTRAAKPFPQIINANTIHICTDCGRNFPTAASFQYHYAKICCHKIGFTAGSLEGTRCPYCHAPFPHEQAVIVHMDVHNNEQNPYRCSFCDRHFPTIEIRRSHELEIHRPGQSRPSGPPRKRIPVAIPRSPSPPLLERQPLTEEPES